MYAIYVVCRMYKGMRSNIRIKKVTRTRYFSSLVVVVYFFSFLLFGLSLFAFSFFFFSCRVVAMKMKQYFFNLIFNS